MKNDFRKRADLALSSLQWNERRTHRVLHALKTKGVQPVMKKKLSVAFALVMTLMLLTAGALAVAALNWSPEASAVNQARQALMDEYGLTRETIALFGSKCDKTEDGWVITFRTETVHESLAGEYTVTITNGAADAAWSYNSMDKALWEDGSLDAPVWGQPQLHSYLHEGYEEAYAISSARWMEHATTVPGTAANPTPTPMPAAAAAQVYTSAEPDPQAREVATAAMIETYQFTEDDIAAGEWLEDIVSTDDGRTLRFMTLYLVKDGVEYLCGVTVDAQTYAIVSIDASTGGNG